jgi:hypothetical protein
MGVLLSFEKRLASIVEGTFAKVFKGSVEPVEIAKALTAEADAHKVVSANRTLVPNSYHVDLGPKDHERLAPYAEPLGAELAAMVREHAEEQRYAFVGPVIVTLGLDAGLDTGVFRVHAEVSPDGAYTPQAPIVPPPAAAPAPFAPPPAPVPLPVPPLLTPSTQRPPETERRTTPPPARIAPPAAPAVPARLLFEDGRAFDLVASLTRIGRSREADLRLDDTAVSRQHAEIRRDGDGRHVLVDLGSTNGTLLNGSRVSTSKLRDGDVVTIGAAVLTYRAAPAVQSAPHPADLGPAFGGESTSVWSGGDAGLD